MFRRNVCLLSTLLLARTAFGTTTFQGDPEYLIDTWETEDGLPENSATSIGQTVDGYLWIGTFKGLVRFDGIKFTAHSASQSPSAGVVNLYVDRQDRLWVSTENGLSLRDGSGWRTFKDQEGWPAGDFARTFTERQNGDVLITSFTGGILEFAGGHLRRLPNPTEGRNGFFGYVDETDGWGVAKKGFVGRWDGQHWVPTVSLKEFGNLPPEHFCAGRARDGGFWLLIKNQLRKYRRGQEVSRLEVPAVLRNFWSLYEDSRTNLWICSINEGLFEITRGGQVRHWTKDNGLPSNSTRFAFEDREQNIWVGTSGNGLMRFKHRRFRSIGFESGLNERVVTSLAAHPDGSVWAGTWGQDVYRLGETGLTHQPFPEELTRHLYVHSVLVDRSAKVWAGTLGHGVWTSERQGFRQTASAINPYALFQDSRGCIWAGDDQKVAVFYLDTTRYYGPEEGLPPGRVRYFAEDNRGKLWFANPGGLFNLVNDRAVEVKDSENQSIADVSCIRPEEDGTLWLGTLNNGLLRWKEGRLTRIDKTRGLPTAGVYEILEDERHFFWMTSSHGIVRAARNDLETAANEGTTFSKYQLLGLSDGLPSVECANGQQPTCTRDSRGYFWFATLKGVAMIDPAHFEPNTNQPLVQIECLAYRTRGVSGGSSLGTNETRIEAPFSGRLVLPPGSRQVQLQYTGLSFRAPEKIRFQVRLEPLDTDWYQTGDRREAQFLDIPPGKYVFHVRAANEDGLWSERVATVAFSVQPFFWQTNWFRGGFALLLINAGGFAAWWRSHRKHRREVLEFENHQRIQAEITQLARVSSLGELAASVVHELTQPLAAILLNAQAAEGYLAQNPPNLNTVRDVIHDIVADDSRAKQIIERLRHLFKHGKLEPERLNFNDLVRSTLKLAKRELRKSHVTVEHEFAVDLPPILADKVQLQQVLLNLVTNARLSMIAVPVAARKLVIRTRLVGSDLVEVTVSDQGHGIAEEDLPRIFEPFFTKRPDGLGIGLAVSRRIIEAHNGKIWAGNNANGGADFQFALPVDKEVTH